jgi:hypothetical protein
MGHGSGFVWGAIQKMSSGVAGHLPTFETKYRLAQELSPIKFLGFARE